MLVDINGAALAARRGAVEALGGRVETQVADVSKSADVQAYVAAALAAFGRIDGFFNNAGMEGKLGPIYEYDEAEFDRIVAVNSDFSRTALRPARHAQAGSRRGRQYGIHRERTGPRGGLCL